MRRLMTIGRRGVTALPVLLGVTLITFFILDSLPGSAARQLLGVNATEEQVLELERSMGLDQSATERYLGWLSRVLRGDLGVSLASQQPVGALVTERLPVSALLISYALLLSIGGAVMLALLAARRPGGLADRAVMMFCMVGISSANYVVALVLVLVVSVQLNLLPSIGFHPISDGILGSLRSLTLPAVAIAFPLSSLYARFLRGDLVEQMQREDYVLTAMAKGLTPGSILVRHAFRNSVFGLLTLIGLNFSALVGGTVIIEQIFALPGLGQLLVSSINFRDFAVVQAVTIVIAFAAVLATLAVDIIQAILDPRVRHAI